MCALVRNIQLSNMVVKFMQSAVMHLLEDHFIFRCMHTSKLSNLLTSLELNIHATFALTRAQNFH